MSSFSWRKGVPRLVAAGLFGLAIGLVLGLMEDWPSTASTRWQAIDAIASVAAALAAFVAVSAVIPAFRSLRETQEIHRLQHLPYLRIYIGFGCELRSAAFQLPADGDNGSNLVVVPRDDVVKDDETRALLEQLERGDTRHVLSVWLENVQTHSLGVALFPELELYVKWRSKGSTGQPPGERSVTCSFPYVNSGQPVRMDLLNVGSDAEEVSVAATEVRYADVTNRTFSGATGPAAFVYNATTDPEEVINGPVILGPA